MFPSFWAILSTLLFSLSTPLSKILSARYPPLFLASATPLREPVAAYGPFVMNTKAEIEQAIDDYRSGRLTR